MASRPRLPTPDDAADDLQPHTRTFSKAFFLPFYRKGVPCAAVFWGVSFNDCLPAFDSREALVWHWEVNWKEAMPQLQSAANQESWPMFGHWTLARAPLENTRSPSECGECDMLFHIICVYSRRPYQWYKHQQMCCSHQKYNNENK